MRAYKRQLLKGVDWLQECHGDWLAVQHGTVLAQDLQKKFEVKTFLDISFSSNKVDEVAFIRVKIVFHFR